jgi:hypothetical protein
MVTTVHDLQVVDEELPEAAHDLTLAQVTAIPVLKRQH